MGTCLSRCLDSVPTPDRSTERTNQSPRPPPLPVRSHQVSNGDKLCTGSRSSAEIANLPESPRDVYVHISLATQALPPAAARGAAAPGEVTGGSGRTPALFLYNCDEGESDERLRVEEEEEEEERRVRKLNALFDKYCDRLGHVQVSTERLREHRLRDSWVGDGEEVDEDCILASGIERLCEDLGVRADDYQVLVLAWRLGARTMCRFTRSEFVSGCFSLGVGNVEELHTMLPQLQSEVERNEQKFRSLYRWSFRFTLDPGQRTLPLDIATSLWRLVFSGATSLHPPTDTGSLPRSRAAGDTGSLPRSKAGSLCSISGEDVRLPGLVRRWLEFLERPGFNGCRGITRDTWDMFINLSDTLHPSPQISLHSAPHFDLSLYDESEAWPSLFDDFVDWLREKQLSS